MPCYSATRKASRHCLPNVETKVQNFGTRQLQDKERFSGVEQSTLSMATEEVKTEIEVEEKQLHESIRQDFNSEHNELNEYNDEDTHYVFFYGSCSPKDIQTANNVTAIESYPAIIPGYVRYFARFSYGRDGGTASIRKATDSDKPYDAVTGWIAKISDDDLDIMDGREGHPYIYKRSYISAQIYLQFGNNKTHIVTLDNVWTYFVVDCLDWICPPSHSYSLLCVKTVQHFWKYNKEIVVRNNEYPLYQINDKGQASKILIFDYFPELNKTVQKHSTKYDGLLASQSEQCKQWRSKRQCIRCQNPTWVCFVDEIALFICDECKAHFGIKEE